MCELIGLCLGIVFSIAIIKAYTIGLNHGKQMNQGATPKLDINPAKTISKAVEQHKEEKKVEALTNELSDVMSYTMESALQAVKKER